MKKYNITVLAIIPLVVIMGINHVDVKAEDQARKKIEKYADFKTMGEITKVETFSIIWNTTMNIPSPDFAVDAGTHMVCYSPYLVPLCKALKKFEYKKAGYYSDIKVLIRFYNSEDDKVLEVELARGGRAILINGEAYEPSSEMMQALKYFMPYQTYEEVSQYGTYFRYFKNDKDKSEDPNSTKYDPNSTK